MKHLKLLLHLADTEICGERISTAEDRALGRLGLLSPEHFDKIIDKLIPMVLESKTEPSNHDRKGFAKMTDRGLVYLAHKDF